MTNARPLRFCMITTFYPPYNFGGDGIYVQRLSNELATRGHHVTIIHSMDAYRLRVRQVPRSTYNEHPNITVVGLASPSKYLATLVTQQTGVPFAYASRIKQILQEGFDVINYHNVSLVGGADVLTYGHGIKLYTLHEYWLVCQTHVLFRNNQQACSEPHCVQCSLAYHRPPQWWRYGSRLRRAVQHIDAFIAPSKFCRDIHRQRGLNAPLVDMPFFLPDAPLAWLDSNPAPYFLFVGRLEKLKGLQTLIPIFRNNTRARLLIAGTGAMENQLRQLAEHSPNIEFLGRMTGAELQTYYRNAIALILPSLCYESFPTVMLEAFQQQTPVIARNLGAMPQVIAESGGGLVYNTDAELTHAIDLLVDNIGYRQTLGMQGYAAYKNNWTAEIHLERYLALIEKIAMKRAS